MATIRNLTIDQASTFGAVVNIESANKTSYDLTGHTATAHIKKSPTSKNITASFLCDIPDPQSGNVYLSLTDEETASIKAGRYMYDLFVENTNGQRYRAVEGMITVTPAITK